MTSALEKLLAKSREIESKKTPEIWTYDRKYGELLDEDSAHQLFFDFRIKTVHRMSGHAGVDTEQDAEFIAHAANNFAKLLEIISVQAEALKSLTAGMVGTSTEAYHAARQAIAKCEEIAKGME